MLDLLEHRVGQSIGEGVAREQQNGQAVGVRHARGGHHIGRARPYGGRCDHDLAAAPRLGEADCRQGHRLFVLPAPRR